MANEVIVDKIAGILRFGAVMRSREVLGAGKIRTPENAMIITNKRVIFVVVPVKGAETVVAGTDIGMLQYLLAQKGLEEKLIKWMRGKSPDALLKSNPKNYAISLNKIQKVKISRFFNRGVKFIMSGGKKYQYLIRKTKDLNKVARIFSNYS